MRTSNPVLNASVFEIESAADTTMTMQGTAAKTAALLALTVVGAGVTWSQVAAAPEMARTYIIGGSLIGLLAALVTAFKRDIAAYTAPIYAGAEGVALGAISMLFESSYPGIVPQAVGLTFGTLAMLLAAYSTGLIRPSENFKLGIAAATGAILLMYVASMVLRLFGTEIPYIHSSGPIGIGFSLFVVAIAALNLVLDFDYIETGVAQGAPKYMEWYAAFGLLVTLVWLYLEILRLLAKLNSRD